MHRINAVMQRKQHTHTLLNVRLNVQKGGCINKWAWARFRITAALQLLKRGSVDIEFLLCADLREIP